MVSRTGMAAAAIAVVVTGLFVMLALMPNGFTSNSNGTGASTAATNAFPATHVLLHEDGEESNFTIWNDRWHRYDANPVDGDDHGCRTMHRAHGSNHSIYSARIGYNSHYQMPITMSDGSTGYVQPWNVNITDLPASTPQSQWVMRYDTNQDSVMQMAITGAQYYGNVSMTFWFWSQTSRSDAAQPGNNSPVGYDFLNALYYTGSGDGIEKHVLWTASYEQATAQQWNQVTLSVPTDATMVGFEFVSGTSAPQGGDASNAFASSGVRVVNGGMHEGVYLDDIYVNGTDPSSGLPLATQVQQLPPGQNGTEFPIGVAVNEPSSLAYVNLYYRMAGNGAWTKYTAPSNHDGRFTSNPIGFAAPGNGTYEFLTQGVDRNGTAEPLKDKADAWTIVDTVAPVTTIKANGAALTSEPLSGPVAVTFDPTDGDSGVKSTFYREDDGAWTLYSGPFTLSVSGAHDLEYYSIDLVGNQEAVRTSTVAIE